MINLHGLVCENCSKLCCSVLSCFVLFCSVFSFWSQSNFLTTTHRKKCVSFSTFFPPYDSYFTFFFLSLCLCCLRAWTVDYLFWVFNFGYVFNELIEVSFDGISEYFSKWQNWLDAAISVNFVIIILLRIWTKWFNDDKTYRVNDGESVFFKIVWCLNVIMLWLRVLHFMMLSSSEGPIVTVEYLCDMICTLHIFFFYLFFFFFVCFRCCVVLLLK